MSRKIGQISSKMNHFFTKIQNLPDSSFKLITCMIQVLAKMI